MARETVRTPPPERLSVRYMLPRIEWGSWGGAALSDNGSPTGDEVRGGAVAIQWLGLMIEIGVGVVR